MRLSIATALALAGGVHALTFAAGPLPPWSLAITQVLALAVLVRAVNGAEHGRRASGHHCATPPRAARFV